MANNIRYCASCGNAFGPLEWKAEFDGYVMHEDCAQQEAEDEEAYHTTTTEAQGTVLGGHKATAASVPSPFEALCGKYWMGQ